MATKNQHSLSKLANYLTKFKRHQNRLLKLYKKCGEERFVDEIYKLELKLIHYINKTDLPAGIPSALAYAVCEAMNKSPKNSTAYDYFLPTGVAYRTTMDYARKIYQTKINFLAAPLSIGPRIQNPHWDEPMYMGFGIILNRNMQADALSALDYALMQKLYANFANNANMPAKKFVETFGSLSCDDKFEMVRLNGDFADNVWPAEPKPIEVLDMPGRPEFFRLEELEGILGKK